MFWQKTSHFEEEVHVLAKKILFSKRSSWFGQKHLIFEKELHGVAETYSFRKGNHVLAKNHFSIPTVYPTKQET